MRTGLPTIPSSSNGRSEASLKTGGRGVAHEGERAPLDDQPESMLEDDQSKHPSRLCGRKPMVEVTLLVNETAKHAVPYALNAANNAALRALAGKGFVTNATLSVTLEAFPVVPTEFRVHNLDLTMT